MIRLGLSNFYGQVIAVEEDGKYYLKLDNYDGMDSVEISQELYEMIEGEFS